MNESRWTTYVLKLIQDKYYVGRTLNFQARQADHFRNDGAEWTRTYPPLEVVLIREHCDAFEEDKITKQYMQRYGIDNVRGGSYVQIQLTTNQRQTLTTELQTAENLCYRCGGNDHFIGDCTFTLPPNSFLAGYESSILPIPLNTNRLANTIENKATTFDVRCVQLTVPRHVQHNSHYYQQEYEDDSDDEDDDSDDSEEEIVGSCYRCGRSSHFANRCYAKFHVNGRKL